MSGMGLGNEVMFNDKGEAHQAYKFLEVDECKKHHSMQTTIKAFVFKKLIIPINWLLKTNKLRRNININLLLKLLKIWMLSC
ncbi:hypothetical protein PSHT_09909 [Puccinia striiformis]|uniref:Uncharacterized protein n=1 Tax=Puccinia striiformis TaxID=27350 RepID=A0A2S4VDF2_9BASI|nr:hypothetical protein PSHT_09909 [Puccinia striiformis]